METHLWNELLRVKPWSLFMLMFMFMLMVVFMFHEDMWRVMRRPKYYPTWKTQQKYHWVTADVVHYQCNFFYILLQPCNGTLPIAPPTDKTSLLYQLQQPGRNTLNSLRSLVFLLQTVKWLASHWGGNQAVDMTFGLGWIRVTSS